MNILAWTHAAVAAVALQPPGTAGALCSRPFYWRRCLPFCFLLLFLFNLHCRFCRNSVFSFLRPLALHCQATLAVACTPQTVTVMDASVMFLPKESVAHRSTIPCT